MIVHVYNPERILSTSTNSPKPVSPPAIPPPPSPKLLRQSLFSGFNSSRGKESPCLISSSRRRRDREAAMDSSSSSSSSAEVAGASEGLWTPSRSGTHSAGAPSQQMACTCHCGGERPGSVGGQNESHYFTPVSSFSHHHHEDPDSLEYHKTAAMDSPPTPTRKASLDRILSPQVNRRMFSSTSPTNPSGSISSPYVSTTTSSNGAGPHHHYNPLSTSMSNASIHSNYSEDSLTAANNGGALLLSSSPYNATASAGHRWNALHYESTPPPGQWIAPAGSGSCMEQRPAVTSTTSLSPNHSTATPLDFSKDSLNNSSSANRAAADEEEEEDEGSCSSSIKLEPLAFTIDFGDVAAANKKKKETPKRLADRLSSSVHHPKRLHPSGGKAEAKGESDGPSEQEASQESRNTKMLKSLSSRLSGGQLNPLTKFGTAETVSAAADPSAQHNSRRSTPGTAPNKNGKGGSNSSSRHSSASRAVETVKTNGVQQQQRANNKSKASLKQRTPSPTPPPSPVKNARAGRAGNLILNQRISAESEEEEASTANECGAEDNQEEEEEGPDNDTASETGTYTIGKDSPSPDEDQSRRDIDRVFGLVLSPPSGLSDVSHHGPSEATSKWIHDWADQAAQQHEEVVPSLPPLLIQTPVSLSKPPSHPTHRPPPPELPTTARPRRRLPNVPPTAAYNGSNGSNNSRSRSSPRLSLADMSDPSDSSLETESFLRDTESVVSAMQARMDGRSSTESDVETRSSSTSYRPTSGQAQLPPELENSRKLSAQLRAKIRSLDESYQASSATAASSSAAAVNRKASYVISSNGGQMGVGASPTGSNVIHNELHGADDAKSLHSDSSLSDITSGETSSRSRHHHQDHKTAQGHQSAPTVRYNRALSLRRGRLGLDAAASDQASPSSSSATPSQGRDRSRANNNSESPSRGPSPQVPLSRKLSSASGQSQASSRAGSVASASSFSRNDGGRFSLRVGGKGSSSSAGNTPKTPKVSSKAGGNSQINTPALPPPHQSMGGSSGSGGPRKSRSNSTLSSKEAEFQNWKRRKNYDPMKAAAEGKKKEAARRSVTHSTLTMSQSMIGTVASSMLNSSPSSQSPSPPPRPMIRSASFTCVNNSKGRSGRSAEPDLKYGNNNNNNGSGSGSRRSSSSNQKAQMFYSSEDESETMYGSPSKKITSSGSPSIPKPSPMSGRQYLALSLMPSSLHHNSPPSLPADFSDLASVTSNDLDLTSSPGSSRRKIYADGDGLPVLMRSSTSNSSLRARNKLEALDNLVISTIFTMSSKIRTNAENLLRKLRPQYLDDLERLGLIDDSLNRLAECVAESPIHAVTGGRSSSRELSGTLKVMKRIEHVFQAMDHILFEEVLDGGGEEGAILNDGTTTEGDTDWNGGYTSGDFY